MVKARRLSLLLALALLPTGVFSKELGDYQLGDKVEEDIVVMVKLNFVDVDGM